MHFYIQNKIKIALGVIFTAGLCSHAQAQQALEQDSLPQKNVYQLPGKAPVYPMIYTKPQTDSNVVQAIGFLKGKSLEATPSNSPLAGIAGRIAGLLVEQGSGEPGSDIPSLSLRGRVPLLLIDGIPRSASAFNPEQVESVTVLKDALATAMLGQRGMNGAILITTRKAGNINAEKSFNLDFKAQAGYQTPLGLRKYLNSYDYARLYNEALVNDGRSALYSQADLDAYKNHTDPYGHPDVDWTKTILKDNALMNRYTLNAAGTSKNVNYFVSLDYMKQDGLIRESDSSLYNTNTSLKRYVFRSNIDARITDRFNVFFNLFGRIKQGNQPGSAGNISTSIAFLLQDFSGLSINSLLNGLRSTPNNAHPVLNPNNTYGGNIYYQNNLYAQATASGYMSDNTSDGFVDVGFRRTMDDVLKGWWVKGTFSYTTFLAQYTNRSKQFQIFQMGRSGTDTTYTRFGPPTLPDQLNRSYVLNRSQQFYTEISTGISRSFNHHDIDAVVTANSASYIFTSNLPDRYKTLAANIKYSLYGKYLLEASVAYSGNNRFMPGKQAGLFPAAGLAWNVDKESFLQNNAFVNSLKLRATYGLTGNANSGYYDYIYRYEGAPGYTFGATPAGYSGLAEANLPYTRTWEKAAKFNTGLDLTFLQNKGWFSFDYYRENFSDLLQRKMNGSASDILGTIYPMMNLGKRRSAGIEANLGWADKAGDLSYSVAGNVGANKTVYTSVDEAAQPYSWMYMAGGATTQQYGYIADGFVTTAGQGPVVEGYQSVPGDIKYVDKNGDGVINMYDRTMVGSNKPVVSYGLNTNIQYKGLYLTLLVQGVSNNIRMITGNTIFDFQFDGLGQAYQHHLNRWTPATAATADYPRLSVGSNVNNYIASTFWLRNLSYLRLRNVELGYDFKGGIIKRAQLQSVRLFINGLNLVTLTPFKLSYPEAPYADYPIQRVVNGGIIIRL